MPGEAMANDYFFVHAPRPPIEALIGTAGGAEPRVMPAVMEAA